MNSSLFNIKLRLASVLRLNYGLSLLKEVTRYIIMPIDAAKDEISKGFAELAVQSKRFHILHISLCTLAMNQEHLLSQGLLS